MMLEGGRHDVTKKGGATVDQSNADIETRLVDIRDMPLRELRDTDRERLSPYIEELLQQVCRPRYNLGTGPPGRVD